MKITFVTAYLDGETLRIETSEGIYFIDKRIRTKTNGQVFNGFPRDDNSNLIPDDDFTLRNAIREGLKSYSDPSFNWGFQP